MKSILRLFLTLTSLVCLAFSLGFMYLCFEESLKETIDFKKMYYGCFFIVVFYVLSKILLYLHNKLDSKV